MSLETMQDLLVDQLRDIYSAEQQMARTLPQIIEHAKSRSLRDSLLAHLESSVKRIERLDRSMELLNHGSRGPMCRGIEGLLDEVAEVLLKGGNPNVVDAALIARAQRVGHYEIAAYSCALTYAKLLGCDQVANLLSQSLMDEEQADESLLRVAEEEVIAQALQADWIDTNRNGK